MTDNFRWQSPTKTNLAGLHAAEERGTIPASYRSLPSTDRRCPASKARPSNPGSDPG